MADHDPQLPQETVNVVDPKEATGPAEEAAAGAPRGIALCLSGGGYRAMLFHVGVLWRLNQAGYLAKTDRFSSVSGGTITAAVLGINWGQLGFDGQGVATRFIGRRDRANPELRERMARLEDETSHNERLQLWIAFDYGGRAEIVEATRRLVEEGVDPRDIDENAIASRLYAPEMPEPDLLIRTSGELRVSNFLLWQLAYTELVFVDTLWPDFGERHLRQALAEYAGRRRRFGGR